MQPAVAGQLEAMEHSLERAASERPPTDQLVDAIRVGDLETCKILASQAPDGLGGRDSVDHATPAHWAALNGQLKILEWLAAAGSPLHERVDRSGMQPLHWACTRGHTEVVKMLLAHGGDIDSLDIKSTPPLVIAAQYDHTILVFFLVRAKVAFFSTLLRSLALSL